MKKILYALLLFIPDCLFGQQYLEMMKDPTVNVYDVQKIADQYFASQGIDSGSGYDVSSDGSGYDFYKHWEWMMEQRYYPSGNRILPSEFGQTFNSATAEARLASASGNWSCLGPLNGDSFKGAGRVNCMASDPSDATIVYSGAATGGIWKSTDGGLNWTPNGDFNQNLGVSAIAIDPSNTNIIYVGTGDYDGGSNMSYGVIKSTDGGNTWALTGLSFAYTQYYQISGISINPGAPSEIVVTTNNALFYSTDGGTSFTQKVTGNFNDVARHPTNNSIVYASSQANNSGGPKLYRSTDGGNSWTVSMSGIGSGGQLIQLAVSPAAPGNVYAANVMNGGIQGFYVSTDSGVTYSLKTSAMSNVNDITQIGYNECLAVSPTNPNTIIFGTVHLARSTDGGATWTQITQWDDPHCDHHWLHYDSNGTLFDGNDGGMWKSPDNGTSWTICNGHFTAQQFYRIGENTGTPDVVLAGSQDNGEQYMSNGTWKQGIGGDAMGAIVDYNNPNIMVGLGYSGSLIKSTDGGQTWNYLSAGSSGIPLGKGAWVTPILIDPVNSNTYYIGFTSVWKSTDGCANWSKISDSAAFGGGNINEMAIAPGNNQIIYVTVADRIYKTTNGGASWSGNLNSGTGSAYISSIKISPANANEVWITKSGYASGQKVYRSTNGGSSWTNMSLNLPNLPFDAIAIQGDTLGGVYAGYDEGVYYINNSLSNWLSFNKNLPNVIVNDLVIYTPTSKIRACTYGRGIWESDLYSADKQAPTAPTGLTAGSITHYSVHLTWTSSTDNVGVTQYNIMQNGTRIRSVPGSDTSVTLAGLSASTSYSFTVTAQDATGNISAASNTATITTKSDSITSNIALLATPSTSYVSPWETLSAVNDGYTPDSSDDKSHGEYGNWNNPNTIEWVEYDWSQMYTITSSDVYWFDDGGGVLTPTTAYIEYWNGSSWVKVGNISNGKDVFNVLTMNNITTNKLRVSMSNTTQSTGIIEWRVWGTPASVVTNNTAPSWATTSTSYIVYPNPATEAVNISVNQAEESHITIYNSQGIRVYENTFTGRLMIERSKLPAPGMYLIMLDAAGHRYEENLVIK